MLWRKPSHRHDGEPCGGRPHGQGAPDLSPLRAPIPPRLGSSAWVRVVVAVTDDMSPSFEAGRGLQISNLLGDREAVSTSVARYAAPCPWTSSVDTPPCSGPGMQPRRLRTPA